MAQADTPTARSSLEDRYRVLLDIGHNLVGMLRPQHLYQSIYTETARVLEAAGFYISLYDRGRDLATVVFFADKGVEKNAAITYRGSESDVLRLGKGSIVHDRVEKHSLMVLGEEDTEITRSAISAPLLYEGEVVGAISTQSYRANAYGEGDLELLQGIADLAAVSINNARHVTELEQRRREAERIEEIGRAITKSLDTTEVLRTVIDAVLELIGADGSTVWLVENDEAIVAASGGKVKLEEGTSFPLTDAIRSTVIQKREPLLVEELSRSPLIPESLRTKIRAGSGILVPLVLDNEVAGGLSAGKVTADSISQEDVDLLFRLASQASVALANARLHSDIQALSLTDPLTGLPNRRHMDIHLEREVAAARRGRAVCVVLFDLDDFKTHNDNLGHIGGDKILKRFGGLLQDETRAMNLAARYGGDEFISILTELPYDGALTHANRVIARVRKDAELSHHGVTVSYGIGEFDPTSMSEGEDLIRAADASLYQAKQKRRRPAGPR